MHLQGILFLRVHVYVCSNDNVIKGIDQHIYYPLHIINVYYSLHIAYISFFVDRKKWGQCCRASQSRQVPV